MERIFVQCPEVSIIQIAFWMHRLNWIDSAQIHIVPASNNSIRINGIDLLCQKVRLIPIVKCPQALDTFTKNSRFDLNPVDLEIWTQFCLMRNECVMCISNDCIVQPSVAIFLFVLLDFILLAFSLSPHKFNLNGTSRVTIRLIDEHCVVHF